MTGAWTEPIHYCHIRSEWRTAIKDDFGKHDFEHIRRGLQEKIEAGGAICPPPDSVFRALDLCRLDAVNVVILGQDPYPQAGLADGLAFSIDGRGDNKRPHSLSRLLKCVSPDGDETYKDRPELWSLARWASQGVLLLNTILTVQENGKPLSHRNVGWQEFTSAIIKSVAHCRKHVVFMLWGSKAHRFFDATGAQEDDHLVLRSAHPRASSSNARKFGRCLFEECNEYLVSHEKRPVSWVDEER